MDLFWRENKPFILAVAGALLAGLIFYWIVISPARSSAQRDRKDLKAVQERLAVLLEKRGQPTDEFVARAKEDLEQIEKNVKAIEADLSVSLPNDFIVPEKEKNQNFYYDTQFNRVKLDVKRKAPKVPPEGVRLPIDDKLGFGQTPSPKAAPEFLVRLAIIHRLILSAFDAQVSEITMLQALPGQNVQGGDPGPAPDTFIQRHDAEIQLKAGYAAFLRLLHSMSQKGSFLALEKVRFTKEDAQAQVGLVEFTVNGLTFNLNGALQGALTGPGPAPGGRGGLFRRGG